MSQTNQVPVRPPSRDKVYDVLDGERDYQNAGQGNAKPHPESGRTDGRLTLGEGILCLERILDTARAEWYKGPDGHKATLPYIRKAAAVAVQLMENYGAVPREFHVPVSAGITGTMQIQDVGDKLAPNYMPSAKGHAPFKQPFPLGFPQT